MFWIPKAEIKAEWPAITAIIIAVVAIIFCSVLVIRGCASTDDNYLDDNKLMILDEVDARSKGNQERMRVLEDELYDLRDQIEMLDAEARASAKEREEIHNAIESATSIDDVDRILRSGVSGISGRGTAGNPSPR